MPATICAHCKAHSNMTFVARVPTRANSNNHYEVQAAFSCDQCGRASLGTTTPKLVQEATSAHNATWWLGETLSWIPRSVGGKDFPDVPPQIADAADEAHQAKSIRAHRAAILLARSVIEATCKDKGVTTGALSTKIDELLTQGLVRSFTKDAAHELRHLGNNMAHGDFVDPVDADDTEAVLAVMDEILDEDYQGPARVQRMRAKRTGP